jgi:hypothetical protein
MATDRRRFARGSGCFTCTGCGKLTRQTGVQDLGSELCPLCYEKCACGNTLSDDGYPGDAWSVFDNCQSIKEVYALLEGELAKLREDDKP